MSRLLSLTHKIVSRLCLLRYVTQGIFKAMNVNKCAAHHAHLTSAACTSSSSPLGLTTARARAQRPSTALCEGERLPSVGRCTAAGGTFKFWVADWSWKLPNPSTFPPQSELLPGCRAPSAHGRFALMNDKMGGDLERIQAVGKYLIEVWTAAGMDMSRVQFLWAADEITKHAREYWPQALDITRRFTVARMKKCCTIMGRAEGALTAAQILYPIMQCTDIFFLKARPHRAWRPGGQLTCLQ